MSNSQVVRELLATLAEIKDMNASEARTLPPAFYTSEEFLELEKKEIFLKEWLCLGRVGEVPNPGDYFAIQILDEPLLVARGHDGKIRVLSNVCRHRSSIVVEGRGNSGHFVCPYHAWTYKNDGQLLRAPHMDEVEAFDVRNCRLPELKSEVWQGFIFVNLDGNATPLEPRLEGLEPYIGNQHPGDMVYQWSREHACNANWKCVAENALEGYHLSTLHRRTLHSSTPTRLSEKLPCGESYTAYRSGYDPKFRPQMPVHPDVTDEEKRFSVLFFIYPSLVVSVAARRMVYLYFFPCSASRLVVRQGLATFDPQPSAETLETMLDPRIVEEDLEQMERLGRGLKSRYVASSPLGPLNLEGTVWDIFQYVARKLVTEEARGTSLRRAS